MTDPVQHPYPECDRLLAVSEYSQAIGEFLETSGFLLAKYIDCEDYHQDGGHCQNGSHLVPVQKSVEQILADYFRIDLVKVEQERRAMLRDMAVPSDNSGVSPL